MVLHGNLSRMPQGKSRALLNASCVFYYLTRGENFESKLLVTILLATSTLKVTCVCYYLANRCYFAINRHLSLVKLKVL